MSRSISDRIITEKHRGKLCCDSAPGQGTTFVIELPIRQQVLDGDGQIPKVPAPVDMTPRV
ncbi:MAG: HAMP domain-containing histidine kinase [Leptolyngbya sp. RL_3_1]|nr:HAMP domain-containing histidine kinase [Leptolyngbya sp. RL_3_1]